MCESKTTKSRENCPKLACACCSPSPQTAPPMLLLAVNQLWKSEIHFHLPAGLLLLVLPLKCYEVDSFRAFTEMMLSVCCSSPMRHKQESK